nr:MAG TPA: hypothetical protein [Caudoviricetes sp.]
MTILRTSCTVHLLGESFSLQRVVVCATMRDICSRLSLGQVSRMVGLAYQKTLLDKDSLYLSTKAIMNIAHYRINVNTFRNFPQNL